MAVNSSNGVIELTHPIHKPSVIVSLSPRPQHPPIAHKRLLAALIHPPLWHRQAQNVVTAIGISIPTGPRVTGRDRSTRASQALEHYPATRALKSAISSSHTGTRSRNATQNDWSRRASKWARSTPCCSTQVK